MTEMKLQERLGSLVDAGQMGVGKMVTERDLEVLKHMARYRVASMLSLRATVFRGGSPNTAGKVTRRLVRNGWVLRHQLGPQVCVFTLSPKACCLMGWPPDLAPRAVRPELMLSDYGFMNFCCQEGQYRERLTREELQEAFPQLLAAGGFDSDRFFLDNGYRPSRCGLVWIDRCEDLQQLASACRSEWEALFRHEPFRGHVGRSGFRLVLVTATAERADVLRRLLNRFQWPENVRLAVEAVPRLLPLYLKLEPCRSGMRGDPEGALGTQKGGRMPGGSATRHVSHPQLVKRDYEICQHLSRYRIATPASLKNVFFRELSRSSVTLVCSRLVRNGWLNRYPFGTKGCYYALSTQGALLLGNSSLAVTEPLSPRELARELCLIKHCFNVGKGRMRLTEEDLSDRHRYLQGYISDHNAYCLDTMAKTERIGMVYVDHKNTPEQTVAICNNELRILLANKPFCELLSRQGFHVAIYTGARQRADVLRSAIEQQKWPQGVRVTIEAAPEILSLDTCFYEQSATDNGQ